MAKRISIYGVKIPYDASIKEGSKEIDNFIKQYLNGAYVLLNKNKRWYAIPNIYYEQVRLENEWGDKMNENEMHELIDYLEMIKRELITIELSNKKDRIDTINFVIGKIDNCLKILRE